MEYLIFALLFLLIILFVNFQSSQSAQNHWLKKRLNELEEEFKKLNITIAEKNQPAEQGNQEKSLDEKVKELEQEAEERKKRLAAIEEMQRQKTLKLQEEKERQAQLSALQPKEIIAGPLPPTTNIPRPILVQKESWWQGFVKRNPDIEKFIGENLINKIGIAVLVLGIAFFVKYAIDKNWIGEAGRVCIGLGCGAILVGIAHYLRKQYRSFSSVLVGGGLSVFYFTIAFAFHQYQLISQPAAFISMIVITAFAVVLSLLYDKQELAVLATIGGFIAPFLVSNGEGNYIVLFTYLIILDLGLLCLSYFKRWPLLNIISLFFTIILYGGWLISTEWNGKGLPSYPNAWIFATLFYLIFLAMNIIHNISRQRSFRAFDYFSLIFINFLYYLAGLYIFSQWHNGDFKGFFTLFLALLNLGLTYYFFKTQKAEPKLLYLLIGLTLSFISLAAPVQLHGHIITLFWAVEAVLLLWLWQRSGIRTFKYAMAIVNTLMMFSIFLNWSEASRQNDSSLYLVFTSMQGFVTSLFVALSLGMSYFLMRKEDQKGNFLIGLRNRYIKDFLICLSVCVLYFTFIFWINYLFRSMTNYDVANIYHRGLTVVFAVLLIYFWQKRTSQQYSWFSLLAAGYASVFYFASTGSVADFINGTIEGIYSGIHGWAHMVVALLMFYLFYLVVGLTRNRITRKKAITTWILSAAIVLLLALECLNIYIFAGHYSINVEILRHQYAKAWLTVLLGTSSFILMWLGMRYKYRVLRVISLSLFSIVLIKLFLFDIRDISEGGKIAAFILLGILLLTVSFMYQKLKKIIIDDEKTD